MEGSNRNIQPLTEEEIVQLEGQGEKILRLLAGLDGAMFDNAVEYAQALAEFGEARMKLDGLKAEKSALVERARNLKGLLNQFPTGGPTWAKR